jgi:Flp pilus assembly protein TadG
MTDLPARPSVHRREISVNRVRMEAMRMLKEERGNVLILAAASLTMLLSFLALSADVGNLFLTQRQLQSLADAAAMAGALEITACNNTAKCGIMTTAASNAMTESGVSLTGVNLTLNNGPSALAGDPNAGKLNYVEAIVTENVPTYFARVFGVTTVAISARAEAGYAIGNNGPCANVIGPSGQTLTLNSGARIVDAAGSNCGLNVNSSGTPAAMENSGATVNVGSYTVHGTVTNNGGSYTPAPTTNSPTVPDPYASLTPPTQPATSPTNSGTVNGATTLQPGTYTGLNFNGSGYTVTLSPGLYYFTGNLMIGGVNLTGTGVTIYMANGSQLNMNSASKMTLTAPTSGLTGCASCTGMLIWQALGNTSAMNLDSGSSSSWGGAIYQPSGQLTLNGDSTVTSYSSIVANTLMVNSSIILSGASSGSGGPPDGSTAIALAE